MAPPHKPQTPAATAPSRKTEKSKNRIKKGSKAKRSSPAKRAPSAKRASSAAATASGAVTTPVAGAPEPKPAAVTKKTPFSEETIEAFEELMREDSSEEDADGFYANASDSEPDGEEYDDLCISFRETEDRIDDYEKIVKDKEEEVKKVIEAAGGVTEEVKELARAVRREGWILEKLLSKLDKTEERLVFLEKKTGDYIKWGYSK